MLQLLAFGLSISTALGLQCHCNQNYVDFLDIAKNKGSDAAKATLGQFHCDLFSSTCEVDERLCPVNSPCQQFIYGQNSSATPIPVCVRYLTPLGKINTGCGWHTEELEPETYQCARVSCVDFESVGMPCGNNNPFRSILYSYICAGENCNDAEFQQACRGV